jgi:hypothetical protein
MDNLNLNPSAAFNPNQAKQEQMTRELRKARNWILGVGIFMFVVDMIYIFGIYGNQLPSAWKTKFLTIDLVVLGFFVGMYVLAYSQPRLACILALCGFWGLQLYMTAVYNVPIYSGIIIKILFTVALVNGIKSASNAETLKKELEQVFG